MGKILINLLYTGKYISETTKIGHEIINLFKDDQGRNFIYITPYGYISSEHNNQIDTVIMARSLGDGLVEIIAKAEGLEQIAVAKHNGKQEAEAMYLCQIDYIHKNHIEYCGKSLDIIMHSANGEKNPLLITYKCNDIRKPSTQLVLGPEGCNTEGVICLEGIKKLNNMSMKLFLSPEDKSEAYETVRALINNSTLWENTNSTERIDINTLAQRDCNSFLSLIRKEDDELVFSNLFAYFFTEYPELFKEFAHEVLGLDVSNNISIVREEANIDILISDESNYIVIENKVKSKINGIRHDIYSDGVQSQLKKYYEYAINKAPDKQVSCFIFSPDYNRIDISKFACGDEYKLIRYSSIYDFFVRNGHLAMYSKYYSELLLSLYPHTKLVYNDLENELKKRFARTIRKIE